MCGRYTLSTGDAGRLVERFDLAPGSRPAPEVLRRFNICPTERVLAVGAGRRPLHLDWGIRPGRGRPPVINARAESAAARPLFAPLIARAESRCLVPADGWYEWLRPERARTRPAPFRYTVAGGDLFAFAGLRTDDAVVVLTTRPNEVCARVHDRMPCVLDGPAAEAAWVEDELDGASVAELLAPLDAARVEVAAASPDVNRAGTEGPGLLAAEPTLF